MSDIDVDPILDQTDVVLSNGAPSFVCDVCGKDFDTAQGLRGHMSSGHRKLVPCPDCGREVREGVGMTMHRRSMHGVLSKASKDNPRKECPECGKRYLSKDLARHLRQVHKMGSKVGRPRKTPAATGIVVRKRGMDLRAEEITRTTCALLWPDGIPPSELEQVLIWHGQTTEFFKQVTPQQEPEQ